MKKIISLIIALAITAIASQDFNQLHKQNIHQDSRLCKLFKDKAIKYEKNMRDDDYAHATLASYKKRAAMFCGDK